jgi:hypothetical protein
VPVLFHTGSTPGIPPSEHFPLERYPGCYHPDAPTYRSACRCSRRPKAMGRPKQAPVPGFLPSRESLAADKGLVHRPLDAPLGFRLPGHSSDSLIRAFTRTPLTRFAPERLPTRTPAPQSIDRLSLGLILPLPQATTAEKATLLGFPHRARPGTRERAPDRAMRSPPTAPYITADCQRS